MINRQITSFTNELIKIAIRKRQARRILNALLEMGEENVPDDLKLLYNTAESVKNQRDFDYFTRAATSEFGPTGYRSFPQNIKAERLDTAKQAKNLPQSEKLEFLKSHTSHDPVNMTVGDPRQLENISGIDKLSPETAHLQQGASVNRVWKGIPTNDSRPKPSGDEPIWTSSIPGVAASYAGKTDPRRSTLYSYDISNVPKEHISLPTKHVASPNVIGKSPEELKSFASHYASSDVGFNPYYETVVRQNHLPEPDAEYRYADPLSGIWRRVKGKRLTDQPSNLVVENPELITSGIEEKKRVQAKLEELARARKQKQLEEEAERLAEAKRQQQLRELAEAQRQQQLRELEEAQKRQRMEEQIRLADESTAKMREEFNLRFDTESKARYEATNKALIEQGFRPLEENKNQLIPKDIPQVSQVQTQPKDIPQVSQTIINTPNQKIEQKPIYRSKVEELGKILSMGKGNPTLHKTLGYGAPLVGAVGLGTGGYYGGKAIGLWDNQQEK